MVQHLLTRFGVTAIAGLVLWSQTAGAALPVIDVANLNRNTVTSIQMVQDVAHQVTQIQHQIRQYEAQLQALRRLDGGSFGAVQGILSGNFRELSGVLRDINAIGYDLNRLRSEYDALFPRGTDWDAVDLAEYEAYYRDWNRELEESARTAMEAQSVIDRTQAYTDEAAQILSRSRASEGHVMQLQSQTQMLGLMSAQIGDLTSTLAASERVVATAAAVSAKEKAAAMKLNEKLWEGYGDVDIPEAKYYSIPLIH
ncbi:Conjugal transfer/entry exclusion protein-like protein [Prosthecochloris aestuarii DSM 271]|uniref:Conjugal transfer/entry exclusion protein-like protein n=2 Tax=Prosthecochloris TaxID=1101 RepID=B4S3J5_PROA2|nr:conjugal transfer protein [Prosthecochloris aestuarii]ACF46734.1 Conjugal transfer/entry exclusion protein-like protein [Prosthecochloris aestuarii DSM 271]